MSALCRCGSKMDMVARAMGADTCSACAFEAGELEMDHGFLLPIRSHADCWAAAEEMGELSNPRRPPLYPARRA